LKYRKGCSASSSKVETFPSSLTATGSRVCSQSLLRAEHHAAAP